jgi:hypothetical protein
MAAAKSHGQTAPASALFGQHLKGLDICIEREYRRWH